MMSELGNGEERGPRPSATKTIGSVRAGFLAAISLFGNGLRQGESERAKNKGPAADGARPKIMIRFLPGSRYGHFFLPLPRLRPSRSVDDSLGKCLALRKRDYRNVVLSAGFDGGLAKPQGVHGRN